MQYLLYIPVLTALILIYFRLAVYFNITDEPNHRSSHKQATIRGGGVIVPLALLLHFLNSGVDYLHFMCGLILISIVSFYDDLRPLSNKIRLVAHLIAVALLFLQVDQMGQPLWIMILASVLVIGIINAYNFMDGINGITGLYSLITVLSLLFVNEKIGFVMPGWLLVFAVSVSVFLFFNFRRKAKCFAGDVGSVSIAFTIIFFVLLLIIKTQELKYAGFLIVYGVDSVTTIIFRLIRGENIFEAHRSHFYQYLANVKHWPHLRVSVLYSLLQVAVNIFIILFDLSYVEFLAFCALSTVIFVYFRFIVEGKKYLLRT